MKYTDFIEVAERTFKEFKKIKEQEANVVLHKEGETAETEQGRGFILDTNIKYFGKECDTLLGDFVEIIMNTESEAPEFVRINMSSAFGVFTKHDYSWDAIEGFVADQIDYAVNIRGNAKAIIDNMGDYSRIKPHLIIRPLNYNIHDISLSGYVYEKVGDIALVLYAVVFDDETNGALNTVKVPAQMFEYWGETWEDVLNEVMMNTYFFAMPRLYTNILETDTTPEEESAFMSEKCTLKEISPSTIPLLTTTRRTNGAIAIFYKGVAEKIAEMFGDSFYVAFTSMHECMLHKYGTMNPETIRRHVRATNQTFGPEDTLSYEVFFFNKETKEFTVV